ncbi:Rossmann-like alpha/beta/alpha sandwich fold containing protein [Trema orientale]|uniref:Rossmann-like alpha/beta/alpha sandwich fold containing protein n=1 Tax=Trema orientale TaxID=63057 RepID=A0A2P5EN57_TREOI|nr:Rossmann-like alpha/beta/alpha sandwich fold containing protein [Trema orientale]
MADSWIRGVVDAIHARPTQCALYLTGGASQAVGWLLSAPGASNTVLETLVPYSRMSMIQLLGKIPTQFCSQNTAEEMALLAYNRALKLSTPGSPVLGVGFTGSLASKRPKLGDHRFHLSTRTSDRLWVSTVTLSKGLRTREQEDFLSSQLLLKAIACACKVPGTFVSDLTESDVSDEYEKEFTEDQELEQLIDGQISFKKAEIFPGSAFVIGADTVARLIHPKYYDGDYNKMLKILTGCKATGCTFLVGGRNVDGVFKVLDDFEIPEELRDMFIPIPVEKFRMDVSSTEIRKKLGM